MNSSLSLNLRGKTLWIAGLAVIVIAALIATMTLVVPRWGKAGDINAEAATVEAQVVTLKAKVAHLDHEKAGLPDARKEIADLELRFPATADEPQSLVTITNAALDAGVNPANVLSVVPSAPVLLAQTAAPVAAAPGAPAAAAPAGEAKVATESVTLTVEASEDQAIEFLRNLEATPRSILVRSVSAVADNTTGMLTTTVTLTLFVMAPPQDPAVKASPAPAASSPTP